MSESDAAPSVIVTDAGPLIALVDADDQEHHKCVAALQTLDGPMMTTWPALTEAMQILSRAGWPGPDQLWSMVHHGLEVADSAVHNENRVRELMAKYSDVPMSLADASLVAMCEAMGTWRIFTLDSDFRVYRGKARQTFDIVP